MKNRISLKEVIDINQWQEIQDHFSEVIGVTIRSIDLNGNLLTRPSNPTRLCEEIIKTSPLALDRCRICLSPSPDALKSNEVWKEGYQCFIDLYNFTVPVTLPRNETIAYIVVGPVILGERPKPNKYREKIAELGIDLDKFMDALIEIEVFSFSGIQSVIELLKDVVSYIVELGYQRFKLERIVPLPKLSKMVYKFYVDKLLNALLEVSFNMTDADFGSIMLLDEKSGELYIKMGKGIKKDIIKRTRLKIGEGIAGLAAQERRLLLVDDKVTDERVKNRLHRPEIKSAIVAPIQTQEQLFGVMNIGTLNVPDKFSLENVNILRQLVKLTATALEDMPET